MATGAHTGLILVTGIDKPGVSESLFDALAPFNVQIIDIEQVVIRDRLILTVLLSLDPAHAKAIESDLMQLGNQIKMDIAADFAAAPTNSIQAKTGLLHIVALSKELKPSAIAAIAKTLASHNGNIERISRTASFPVTAIEFLVSGVESRHIKKHLAEVAKEVGIDLAISPSGLMRWSKKLVVLDVDSTLIQQEVIELLAVHAGAGDEVKTITDSAMRGEIDFAESLRKRVALLAGLPAGVLEEVRSDIKLTPGARTLVNTLHKLGHVVGVVSGGFLEVIEPLITELGIKHYRANTLEIQDGKLTGNVLGDIVDRAAKATALKEYAEMEKLSLDATIAIGDGANDLDMITLAGLGIAFNAKPAVQAAADSTVNTPYLDSVLFLLGIAREDIESEMGVN